MPGKSPLLRSRSPPDHDPEPIVVQLSDSASFLDALGSRTAREILAILAEEPMPISEVAQSVGTSLQNVAYHVGNLQKTGLVEVVDTWYSSKGAEMEIFAATHEPLVISLREEDESPGDAIEDAEPRADGLVSCE